MDCGAGWESEFELGAIFQARNDAEIPNDKSGTRFSLEELVGSGPWTSARFNPTWNINECHGMRLVLTPLSYDEAGLFDEVVKFDGETFVPNKQVKATY